MSDFALLTDRELPPGFQYPKHFLRLVEHGLTDIQPWYILQASGLRETQKGLSERYSKRALIPFAHRQDNDDVACWELGRGGMVMVIHDFASPGWEDEAQFPAFNDWLRHAFEEFILWSEIGE